MSKKGEKKNKAIDWVALERDYRTGQYSNMELSRRFNCAESTIRSRAKTRAWAKDLRPHVKEQTERKLLETELRKSGSNMSEPISDEEVVEKAAERAAHVVRTHRSELDKARALVASMFAEIFDLGENPPEAFAIVQLAAEIRRTEGRKGEAKAIKSMAKTPPETAAFKAMTLKTRTEMVRNLAGAMKSLVTLERTAYNLDAKDSDIPKDHIPLEERVKSYTESLKSTGTDNVVPFKPTTEE